MIVIPLGGSGQKNAQRRELVYQSLKQSTGLAECLYLRVGGYVIGKETGP